MVSNTKTLLLFLSFHNIAFAAKPSSGCGKTAEFKSGNHTTTINSKQRLYQLRIPETYNNTHPYRLIFTFHGYGGSGSIVADGGQDYLPYFGLPPLANDDAIFVSPTGLNTVWGNTGGEDIAFVDDMVKMIEDNLCIDQNLRFSTGFSFGGAMSYAIACARAKVFRAVAVISGGPLSGCVGGTDPIAYYAQHGVSDPMIPIASGRQLRDTFVRTNGCAAQTPVEPAAGSGNMTKTTYNCTAGYPVVWVAFDGVHTPTPKLKGSNSTFTAVESWEFFKQFN